MKRNKVPDLVAELKDELLDKEKFYQRVQQLKRENPGMDVFYVIHQGRPLYYIHSHIEKPEGAGGGLR